MQKQNEIVKGNDVMELAIINQFELTPEDMTNIFSQYDENEGAPIRYSSTDNKTYLFNSANGGGESITKIFDEVITVVAIVITSANVPVIMSQPNGDRVSRPCINFFTDDGRHYASISSGVARAARNILGCGFIPTADDPINISFRQIKTPKGIAHTFDLCELEEEQS